MEVLKDAWKFESGRRLLPYDLFKWWGRRPALLVTSLLIDAIGADRSTLEDVTKARLNYKYVDVLNNLTVCDPMCGGGTTAIEALFLGAKEVICSDINFASAVVVNAMIKVIEYCSDIFSTFASILREVYEELKDLWCFDEYCYVHTFLTRECDNYYCYTRKWVGTFRAKGDIVKVTINENGEFSNNNSVSVNDIVKLPKDKLVEVSKNVYAYAAELYRADKSVKRVFVSLIKDKYVAEHLMRAQEKASKLLPATCTAIVNGRETRRLFKEGITCWEQLFTPRQLFTLKRFLELVYEKRKDLIDVAVALIGTVIRTTSMLAFYYQPYAKVNPGLVIKSFWVPRHPVELNPIAGDITNMKTIGRGTIFTYLRKFKKVCDKLEEFNDKYVCNKIKVFTEDAFKLDYSGCDIVILDPPYPGKMAYDELTQIYTLPYRLIGMNVPLISNEAIDIYDLNKYTVALEQLITTILNQSQKATIYLLMSDDKKGRNIYEKLTDILSRQDIEVKSSDNVIGEAPGVLGRSKTKRILIMKIARAHRCK